MCTDKLCCYELLCRCKFQFVVGIKLFTDSLERKTGKWQRKKKEGGMWDRGFADCLIFDDLYTLFMVFMFIIICWIVNGI